MSGFETGLFKRPWVRYGFAVVAVAAAFLLRRALSAQVGEGLPLYVTFYPAVIVAALLAGLGPGLLATAVTLVVVDYWIVSPKIFFWHGEVAEVSAREFLASLPGCSPQCVVLDIHMPEMTGLELQARLAAQGWCVPVILMTAYDTPQTRQRARQAGGFGLLLKPFDKQALLNAVAAAVSCQLSGTPSR